VNFFNFLKKLKIIMEKFLKSVKIESFPGLDRGEGLKINYKGRDIIFIFHHYLNNNTMTVSFLISDDYNGIGYSEKLLEKKVNKDDSFFELYEYTKKELEKTNFCTFCNQLQLSSSLINDIICKPCYKHKIFGDKRKSTKFIDPEDICYICQSNLSDSQTDELYVLNCCNNIVHYDCLKKYCDSLIEDDGDMKVYTCGLCKKDDIPFHAQYEMIKHKCFIDFDFE